MTKPIVKREYVQAFTKGHGTYTVREQNLARDLERAYTMIEELRDQCDQRVKFAESRGDIDPSNKIIRNQLIRILGGA